MIVALDPHNLSDDLGRRYDNAGEARNYLQRNPTTGGFGILRIGKNPYRGRRLLSEFFEAREVDFTGTKIVNQLNIVAFVTRF